MENKRGFAAAAAALAVPAILTLGVEGPSSALISQYLGAVALITMAISQVIATRVGFVETLFGPLDKAYVLHKWLGITALVSVLLHNSIDAEIKRHGSQSKLSDIAEGLGEQSLNGLLVLIAITLITIIPYRLWYWTHRAMGVCFLLGAAHYALILKPFLLSDPLGMYVLAFCLVGSAAYAYTLAPRDWRKGAKYKIAKLETSGNAKVITMEPVSRPLHHRAGQFAFFTFEGCNETHPFTISNAPQQDGILRISVAALGDYTSTLESRLSAGMDVRVHGPYGRFSPTKGTRPQVWIAGGIGVTPFLAALQRLEERGPRIEFFYTFRGADTAPHLQEIMAFSAKHERVKLHLIDTSLGPRLSPEAVSQAFAGEKPRYSFCGPAALRKSLMGGLGRRSFHHEVFEIRTGLPVTMEDMRGLAGVLWRVADTFVRSKIVAR
jgi:predicted ferric reductase